MENHELQSNIDGRSRFDAYRIIIHRLTRNGADFLNKSALTMVVCACAIGMKGRIFHFLAFLTGFYLVRNAD